eukprot:scaffold12471_cov111-Isochrysis_galbana.AAC.3
MPAASVTVSVWYVGKYSSCSLHCVASSARFARSMWLTPMMAAPGRGGARAHMGRGRVEGVWPEWAWSKGASTLDQAGRG